MRWRSSSVMSKSAGSFGNEVAMSVRVGLRFARGRESARGAPNFKVKASGSDLGRLDVQDFAGSKSGSSKASWPPGSRARGRRAGARSPHDTIGELEATLEGPLGDAGLPIFHYLECRTRSAMAG